MPLLVDILREAPDVKMLVTTRERLHLRGERLFPISGLPPPPESPENVQDYDSVQLFLQHAPPLPSHEPFPRSDLRCVARICRLVEGMPLGIELAAAWMGELTCQEIADAIERNLDVLSTSMYDVPARHQSMQALFDHSWRLLSPAEQALFRKLSIFRGGFTCEAAREVAGASAATLGRLVDSSLVRRNDEGRYEMHPLVRQYATEKLHEVPQVEARTRDAHAHYYARFLREHEEPMQGDGQRQALEAIAVEWENVRAAWQRLVEQADLAGIEQALHGLFLFVDLRSRFQEGEQFLQAAINRLNEIESYRAASLRARIVTRQTRLLGWLSRFDEARKRLDQSLAFFRREDDPAETALAVSFLGEVERRAGRLKEARQLLEEGLALYRALDDRRCMARTLNSLAVVLRKLGKMEAALRCSEKSLVLFQETADPRGEANALHTFGWIAAEMGHYAEAERYYRRSLAIKEVLGDTSGLGTLLSVMGMLYKDMGRYVEAERLYQRSLGIHRDLGTTRYVGDILNNLGVVTALQEEYQAARAYYEEALEIWSDIGNKMGTAIALSNLGELAVLTGEYEEAKRHLVQSIQLDREIGRPKGIAYSLVYLGDAFSALGDHESARKYYCEALSLSVDMQVVPLTLLVLASIANLLFQTQQKKAAGLLSLVLNHPASNAEVRKKAQRLLTQCSPSLVTDVRDKWESNASGLELVVTTILAELGRTRGAS